MKHLLNTGKKPSVGVGDLVNVNGELRKVSDITYSTTEPEIFPESGDKAWFVTTEEASADEVDALLNEKLRDINYALKNDLGDQYIPITSITPNETSIRRVGREIKPASTEPVSASTAQSKLSAIGGKNKNGKIYLDPTQALAAAGYTGSKGNYKDPDGNYLRNSEYEQIKDDLAGTYYKPETDSFAHNDGNFFDETRVALRHLRLAIDMPKKS